MLEQALLKQGLDLLKGKGSISQTTYDELTTFVNSISSNSFRVVEYKDFNKTTSSPTLTFNDVDRKVNNTTGTSLFINTNVVNIGIAKIIGIKSISTEQDSVDFQISTDSINFYNLSSCGENVTGNFYLKILTGTINSFEKFIILFER